MSEQRLFISHASEDSATVDRIVAYLEARGAPCWISSRDIPPRAIYADAITAAMQACSGCAVVLSAAANQSKAVKRELELASHYDKPFIPIRIDASEPAAGVDYYLRNTQWLDYRRDGERALDRIVGQAPGASPPRPQASTQSQHSKRSFAPWLLAAALLTIGVGGWFVWTLTNPTARGGSSDAATPIESAALALAGSYHWTGVACGEGPTITREGDVLVFTMPGTPTSRHQVLSAQQNTEGFAYVVRTRVLEPAQSRDVEYTLALDDAAGTLNVATSRQVNSWDRCAEWRP